MFVLQLNVSLKLGCSTAKSPGSWTSQEANARLKCVYFPVTEGGESIEMIIEKLNSKGREFLKTMKLSVVLLSVILVVFFQMLAGHGFSFMDLRQKKGDKAHLLHRCCSRAKCFIGMFYKICLVVDTNDSFNPTPSKSWKTVNSFATGKGISRLAFVDA
ncbi:hypothetical protein Patl1_20442 [Pistacia atlantica]|uniref:Uncharacterized protein n=1 Tax=Pistacia atlantica TaxID=434234 RepID=A0ACC1BIJ0_9ROSI|nr:hypothetical protein Patl1_20442 [Pistacia atlantica]